MIQKPNRERFEDRAEIFCSRAFFVIQARGAKNDKGEPAHQSYMVSRMKTPELILVEYRYDLQTSF